MRLLLKLAKTFSYYQKRFWQYLSKQLKSVFTKIKIKIFIKKKHFNKTASIENNTQQKQL